MDVSVIKLCSIRSVDMSNGQTSGFGHVHSLESQMWCHTCYTDVEQQFSSHPWPAYIIQPPFRYIRAEIRAVACMRMRLWLMGTVSCCGGGSGSRWRQQHSVWRFAVQCCSVKKQTKYFRCDSVHATWMTQTTSCIDCLSVSSGMDMKCNKLRLARSLLLVFICSTIWLTFSRDVLRRWMYSNNSLVKNLDGKYLSLFCNNYVSHLICIQLIATYCMFNEKATT